MSLTQSRCLQSWTTRRSVISINIKSTPFIYKNTSPRDIIQQYTHHLGFKSPESNTQSKVCLVSIMTCLLNYELKPIFFRMSSTTETLSDINHLLSVHNTLVRRIRNTQRAHRDDLRTLPSPPETLLQLPLIRTPSPSPPSSPYTRPSQSHVHTSTPGPASAPSQNPRLRTDLPPEKRVRLARYAHYIPEEETFRNNFCQRYVDSGDWPQNWVLGADLEKRFEE